MRVRKWIFLLKEGCPSTTILGLLFRKDGILRPERLNIFERSDLQRCRLNKVRGAIKRFRALLEGERC